MQKATRNRFAKQQEQHYQSSTVDKSFSEGVKAQPVTPSFGAGGTVGGLRSGSSPPARKPQHIPPLGGLHVRDRWAQSAWKMLNANNFRLRDFFPGS